MRNTPTYIYKEFQKRKIPIEIISEESTLMRYKHRGKWRLLRGCMTEDTSMIGYSVCERKDNTEIFARMAGLPLLASDTYSDDKQALEFIEKYGPAVIKPVDTAHGAGITMNVRSKTGLAKARAAVKKVSSKPPLLQQTAHGTDLRVMVIGGKYAAAVNRVPASVIGDGEHTVGQLIELENGLSHRTTGKYGRLGVIKTDIVKKFLGRRQISRIPVKGERVFVSRLSNTSLGGHAEDATDEVPESIRRQAEEFSCLLGLPVCGLDFIVDQDSGDYYFLEANARPGFGPHHHPLVGQPRDVTKAFVDYLLSDKRK